MLRPLAMALLLAAALPALASADYSAKRFDSRIRVLPGGDLEVTETVVFRFEGRTYTRVFREIRTRRTDGIEILSAAMDGRTLPAGTGPGSIEISGTSRVKATWHFQPTTDAAHTFELKYLVRGAVRQDDTADVVAWRALPAEHKYTIDAATVDIDLPGAPLPEPPHIDRQRVGQINTTVEDSHVRVTATAIRTNGWIEASIRLPRGSVISAPPDWQARDLRRRELAPGSMAAAGLIVLLGLVTLFAIRQSYDAPPQDIALSAPVVSAPDTLPPALAGPLTTNGRVQNEHAMAAMFSLADHGEVTINEQPKSYGQRRFLLTRNRGTGRLLPHEQTLLDIVFSGKQGPEPSVAINTARNRVAWQFKRFRRAVDAELAAAGLLDDARGSTRRRFRTVGLVCMLLAAIVPAVLALFVTTFGPWPMVTAIGFVVVAITALVCDAAHTSFSNEGVRRSRRWRGFQAYLKDVARDRAHGTRLDAGQLLPFAVAFGLADAWSKFLKNHHEATPPWFRALTASDSGPAFSAFLASGATTGGHGGHGGGGAAGGGSSGAG